MHEKLSRHTPVPIARNIRSSRHLPLVARWEDWLRLVGNGEEQAAGALLQISPHGQASQLPLGENPTQASEGDTGEATESDQAEDLSDRYWAQDESGEKVWLTDFPPPPGFKAYESRPYDEESEELYERECTLEEVALIEGIEAADAASARAREEKLRDAWFAALRAELDGSAGEPGAASTLARVNDE